MGIPRYLTGRRRAILLTGSFSLSVRTDIYFAYFYDHGGLIRELASFDYIDGNVRLRCGAWTYRDGAGPFERTEAFGATFEIRPRLILRYEGYTPFPGRDHFYVSPGAEIVSTPYGGLRGSIAAAGEVDLGVVYLQPFNFGVAPGAVYDPPISLQYTIAGSYSIQYSLRESMDMPRVTRVETDAFGRSSNADYYPCVFTEDFDPEEESFIEITIAGTTKRVDLTSVPNNWAPYSTLFAGDLRTYSDTYADGTTDIGGGGSASISGSSTGTPFPAFAQSQGGIGTVSGGSSGLSVSVEAAPAPPVDPAGGTFERVNGVLGLVEGQPASSITLHGKFADVYGGLDTAPHILEMTEELGRLTTVKATTTVTGDYTRVFSDGGAHRGIATFFQGMGRPPSLAEEFYRSYQDIKLLDPLPRTYVRAREAGPLPVYFPARGQAWDALNISQAADVTVDAAPWPLSGSALWTGNPITALSEVSGNLRLVVGAAGGGVTSGGAARTYASPGKKRRYRYLKIRVRSIGSANRPLTIRFGSHTYNFTTVTQDISGFSTGADGQWVDLLIDLAHYPANPSQSSIVPEEADGRALTPPTFTGFSIRDLAVNATYEIESVKLARVRETLVSGFGNIQGTTDGALTLDIANTVGSDALPGVGTHTIAGKAGQIAAETGWAAAVLCPKAPGKIPLATAYSSAGYTYYNWADFQDEEAWNYYLFGGGVVEGDPQIDKDATAGYIVRAQHLCGDGVSLYPLCGDVFNQGAYGGDTPLDISSWSGGAIFGVVVPVGGAHGGIALAGGATVRLSRVTTGPQDAAHPIPDVLTREPLGEGTARASGFYATGSPGGVGWLRVDLDNAWPGPPYNLVSPVNGARLPYAQGNPIFFPNIIVPIAGRVYVSWLWGGAPPGQNPWNHNATIGFFHRADVRGGNVWLRRSDHSTPPFVVQTQVTNGGSDSQPRSVTDAWGRIWVVFTRGGSVYETYSDDDGLTWSTPTVAIPGGRHPHVATDHNGGVIIRAAYVSGNLKGNLQAPGDVALGSLFTFKNAAGANLSVQDDSFGLSAAYEGGAGWLLSVLIVGETDTSDWISHDDAQTWTRL